VPLPPLSASRFRTLSGLALVAAVAIGVSACGEKEEPDLSQLPPPPQPQAPNPPKGLPQAVVGQWQGTLRQKGVQPFPIGVRIVSATEPEQNTVHYGGQIDCSGNWRYLDAEGPQVHFRELIDSGAGGDCKGTGNVTVTPLEGTAPRLRYEFIGGGIESRGVLSKR
jgi:hypothetical protein